MENILEALRKPLKIEDVDFRVQSINKGGYATILAYKDARVDMNRLDEVCKTNWQDKYELIDGQLFCSIGIKIDDEWIWRQDVGTESFTEKTKGRASDAFKRAGFRWGIGRELYDYPLISVKLNPIEYSVQGDKVKATFNLKLKDWKWDAEFKDGKVEKLTAHDEKGVLRFDSSETQKTVAPKKQAAQTQRPAKQTGEKPWLNKMDRETKSFTKEWMNVIDGINKGKVTSVDDVKIHYRLSKEIEATIINTINLTPAQ